MEKLSANIILEKVTTITRTFRENRERLRANYRHKITDI